MYDEGAMLYHFLLKKWGEKQKQNKENGNGKEKTNDGNYKIILMLK